MYEGMPRCSTFDFSQSNQIASLKIAVAVLKLPQRAIGRCAVENVRYFVKSVLIKALVCCSMSRG